MQFNRHFLTTAALVVVAMFMLDVPLAKADTAWQSNGSTFDGNWTDTAHWDNGVPTSTDIVTFPTGSGAYTVTMNATGGGGSDEGYAKQLVMHLDAKINIPANKILEIGSADVQTSDIDGKIVLQQSSSVLRIMFNHTFKPKTINTSTGRVIGENNGAVIEDDPDNASSLTIAMNGTGKFSIVGALKIQLDLVNDGCVIANDGSPGSDRLTLDIGIFDGAGTYEVNEGGAFLQFSSGITANGLTGPFTVSNGTLDIRDDDVKTDDDLTLSGSGKILVDDGAMFTAG